jgi:hypothetical protein
VVPPCHVLFGISRIADPRCKFPCGQNPETSNADMRDLTPRVPSINQRSRLNREIAIRDFKGYGTHASSNAEGRYLDSAWTCWCRRVKSLAPSLRSKGYRVSVRDLWLTGILPESNYSDPSFLSKFGNGSLLSTAAIS